jgi:hypothetical protein
VVGTNLRQEIIQLARGLPNTYADIAQQAKVHIPEMEITKNKNL